VESAGPSKEISLVELGATVLVAVDCIASRRSDTAYSTLWYQKIAVAATVMRKRRMGSPVVITTTTQGTKNKAISTIVTWACVVDHVGA
jgi:hypothetical protein